ncbi:MAG: hypothetical protein ACI9VR_002354 [Cognaticolwellia sp.]
MTHPAETQPAETGPVVKTQPEQTLGQALERALESGAEERVVVQAKGARAWVDLKEVGPIGVRVLGVELEVEEASPPSIQAKALGGLLPGLPGPLNPVEVDDGLGGGLMRTPLRKDRFVELELRGGKGTLRPMHLNAGRRAPASLDMSRQGLGELLEELAQALSNAGD